MSDELTTWREVDQACDEFLGIAPYSVRIAAARCVELGLPEISVTPALGRFLMLLARMTNASRILEVGTLGGYSTSWLAEGATPNGLVTTIELDRMRASDAQETFHRGGIADRVDVRCGAALDVMDHLVRDATAFDLVFIDADKENSANYFDLALAMTRVGGIIVVDNVIREGAIIDANHADERVRGSRRAIARIGAEPTVLATVLQTVGAKGYDGFALAVVSAAARRDI